VDWSRAFYQILTQVQEPPEGELALLRWIIVILISVIIALASVIAFMYRSNQKREDEMRKEFVEALKALSEDVNNLNMVLNITDEMRKIAQAVVEESNKGGKRAGF
jgi:flagellar basal body-associated protein FliL